VTGSVIMPVYSLLSFLTLPLALKAMKGSREYLDREKLVPALGSNVMFILSTQFLLGVAYILDRVYPLL